MASADVISASPTTLATASTCTGWTANTNPATSAAGSGMSAAHTNSVSTDTAACPTTFAAWKRSGAWRPTV